VARDEPHGRGWYELLDVSQGAVSVSRELSHAPLSQVFSDYMKSLTTKGGDIVRYLPSPVYLYGMVPGQSFTLSIPSATLSMPSQPPNLLSAECCSAESGELCQVTVVLERISSLKNGARDFIFTVNGVQQVAVVKDTCSTFVFEGRMATPGNASEIAR
jgi:hypothetical protein